MKIASRATEPKRALRENECARDIVKLGEALMDKNIKICWQPLPLTCLLHSMSVQFPHTATRSRTHPPQEKERSAARSNEIATKFIA